MSRHRGDHLRGGRGRRSASCRDARPSAARASAPRLSAYARRLDQAIPTVPSSPSAARAPASRYDFRYGRPSGGRVPARDLAAAPRRAGATGLAPSRFGYGSPAGYGPLRAALSEYLGRARGVGCDAERIVIVNGSQQALDLDLARAPRPRRWRGGRGAALLPAPPSPSRRRARDSCRVPVDASGLDTSKLPPAGAGARARLRDAVPPVPHRRHHAARAAAGAPPLGLPGRRLARRGRLRQRVPLRGPPAGGAPVAGPRRAGRSTSGSFSKTLFPALRLAYLVLPPSLCAPLHRRQVGGRSLLGSALPRRRSPTSSPAASSSATCAAPAPATPGAGRPSSRRCAVHFGSRVEIAGENTGVHLVVWFNDAAPAGARRASSRARRRAGVSVYSIAPPTTRPPAARGSPLRLRGAE